MLRFGRYYRIENAAEHLEAISLKKTGQHVINKTQIAFDFIRRDIIDNKALRNMFL